MIMMTMTQRDHKDYKELPNEAAWISKKGWQEKCHDDDKAMTVSNERNENGVMILEPTHSKGRER